MKLLNEILGTKYPIIQGGMANIATGEFAAALLLLFPLVGINDDGAYPVAGVG